MRFEYDDGGRAAAGFKGDAGDCVVRAISIAAEKPYIDVYKTIHILQGHKQDKCGRHASPRDGVMSKTYEKLLAQLGFKWRPTMFIGSGCKVHLRDGELPMGRLIVNCSRHLVAVVDGVIHDTYDPSRDGMRCVYGYWSRM